MRKGFVLLETIIVVSVVSVALLILYRSYQNIMAKSEYTNVNDTTELIYKTFLIKRDIEQNSGMTIREYMCGSNTTALSCERQRNSDPSLNRVDSVYVNSFEVFKIYYFDKEFFNLSKETKDATNYRSWSASSVDYFNTLYSTSDILVVNYIIDGKHHYCYIEV